MVRFRAPLPNIGRGVTPAPFAFSRPHPMNADTKQGADMVIHPF
jgi:hypothetical protein